jgi:uncharacterized membrane protein (GlpM family)
MPVLFALIGIYVIWVALPLMPAILIYRLFPSTTVAVSGPLAHLTVKAGGAFAAYLIIFAATYFFVQKMTEEAIVSLKRQVWTINAEVVIKDENGKDINARAIFESAIVKTEPNPHEIKRGHLRSRIVEREEGDFPTIVVEIPQFGEGVIDLNDLSAIAINKFNKTIKIKQPIVVQAAPRIGVTAIGSEVEDGRD